MRVSFCIVAIAVLLGTAPHTAQADSLRITPSEIVLPLGGAQRLELRDASGAVVTGAEWTASTAGIVSLSTSPIVTIAAVAAGQVTVTATVSGQTVEASVTVLTVMEVPPGTPVWSLPKAMPEEGTSMKVIAAQNDNGSGADYFALEHFQGWNANNEYEVKTAVRGVRLDGTEAWRRSLTTNWVIGQTMADANGGFIVSMYDSTVYPNHCDLVRLDGNSGAETWRLPRNGCFGKPALLPSGIVVAAVSEGDSALHMLGVHPETGSIQFDVPTAGSMSFCGIQSHAGLSDLTVGSDGQAYAIRHRWALETDSSCMFYSTYDAWHELVVVQPTGSLAVIEMLYETHQNLGGGYQSVYEYLADAKIFPGAAGGLTISWMTDLGGGYDTHFYVTTLNGGRSDIEVSTLVEAVGSDGSGYGLGVSAVRAIDTVSGTQKWTSAEVGTVSAVLSDLSLIVLNYSGESVHIDTTGQSTLLGNFSSVSEVLVDSPEQRLMAVGGAVVAVPGGGLELDSLFPVQDGNTKRQRTRPAPALTVSRPTVTRGQPATFQLTGVLPSEVVEWRFVPDDTSLPPVVRTSSALPLVWNGSMLATGEVRATVMANGAPKQLVRRVEVAPRPGFSLLIPPPPAELKPHGFTPPGSTSGPMQLPSPPQSDTALAESRMEIPYTFSRANLVSDQGPNHGYRTVDGVELPPDSLPYYVYVLVPDLEPGSEFYQKQCGNWSETNPGGTISGEALRLIAIQHEGGASGRSHYVQFIDALADSNNDLAKAIETIVVGGLAASDTNAYDTAVTTAMTNGVFKRIKDATGIEPCSGASFDGSSGVCVFRGYLNYPPYATCP
jgi:hypothetical protein